MIAEDAVVNMDKNLDRIRAAGDIKRFFAKKRLDISVSYTHLTLPTTPYV